jgi:hypothetical protein
LKARLVDLQGGKCELCGYAGCLRALSCHHLDPTTKRFVIAGAHTRSWAKLVEETRRCVLLCANCHIEVEAGLRSIPSRIRNRIERALIGIERRPAPTPGRPAQDRALAVQAEPDAR